ncbi:Phosphohistidine phosphatase SixA [hydrothermal vent metagenome]|uniref:Phosphohistidine phosphatase SixA n=1 Tax=hydrothermal vent metagenome TaxID=652676 RepID=A0A3B0W5Y9_9ZZZZ
MPTKLRELMLLRHAKSEWKNSDLTDIERPLSDRGKRNASKMGRWLKEHALIPDLILVSPAQRAQQTLRRICNEFSANTISIDSLYLADLNTLLHTLSETPQAERVMIIGHNPGLEELFEFLKHDINPNTLVTKTFEAVTLFPTSSLAHFILPQSWQTLEKGDGKLIQFIRPKDI